MTQPEKRNLNNPLSTSIFDDNKPVESSRPPTRVSRRTGLYIPAKGAGDFASPIYTDEVSKMNQEAEQSARKKARSQGGKYVESEDGSRTWMPGPYYKGEPVDYSFEQIVKGDDGKWKRVQKNIRMRKPEGVSKPKVNKINYPDNLILKDDKGNVVTRVGEDGIKRAVRGIQSKENTPTNEPIRSVKRKGGEVRTNRGTSNTTTNNKSNTTTNNKSNTTNTRTSEVKTSKGRTSSTSSSNKGKTYTERTGKQTQRGTGKTYEDVWNNSSAEYKKRFGGDKQKAIQAMKDWNAKQDAKKAKNTTTTKKKNASANTVSETEKKKLTSRSMFDKIPQGRKI